MRKENKLENIKKASIHFHKDNDFRDLDKRV